MILNERRYISFAPFCPSDFETASPHFRKTLLFELVKEFDYGLLIQIELNGKKVYFFGVYLAFCHNENKETYQDQLNEIASWVEMYHDTIIVLGDFNSYPKGVLCPRAERPENMKINDFGQVLADFIISNELVAQDIEHGEGPCHTFKAGTYIDHIVVSKSFDIRIEKCFVVKEDADNFSDHLPVAINLGCGPSHTTPPDILNSSYIPPFWSDEDAKVNYNIILSRKTPEMLSIADWGNYRSH